MTLMEALVAAAVGLLVAGGALGLLRHVTVNATRLSSRLASCDRLELVEQRLREDLSGAQRITPQNTAMTFERMQGRGLKRISGSWSWAGAQLARNGVPVLGDVRFACFERLPNSGVIRVSIALTGQAATAFLVEDVNAR